MCAPLLFILYHYIELNLHFGLVPELHQVSGIQFTTHFIEFFVVQTKRFVVSFVHVIMTRQNCGQLPSRGLRKANADAKEIIFPSKFARCSEYQNVEQTKF